MEQPTRLQYPAGCYFDGPLSKNLKTAVLRSLQVQLIPRINDNSGRGGSANYLDINGSVSKTLLRRLGQLAKDESERAKLLQVRSPPRAAAAPP